MHKMYWIDSMVFEIKDISEVWIDSNWSFKYQNNFQSKQSELIIELHVE